MRKKFYHCGKNVVIKPVLNSANERYISLGNNVNIGAWCRITVSTDFNGIECHSKRDVRLKIGDNVSIGNNSFISANNDVEIGNNVIMSADVFISDHDHGYENIELDLFHQPLSENGYAKIGDNVFIGVKASVLKNVTIGQHSVVAANAVVTKNVPPYCVVAGNPAKIIKQYNQIQRTWVKIDTN